MGVRARQIALDEAAKAKKLLESGQTPDANASQGLINQFNRLQADQQKAQAAQAAIKAAGLKLADPGILSRSAARALDNGTSGGSRFVQRQVKIVRANQALRAGNISIAEYQKIVGQTENKFRQAERNFTLQKARSAATTARSNLVNSRVAQEKAVIESQKQNKINQTINRTNQLNKVRNDVVSAGFDPASLQRAQGRPNPRAAEKINTISEQRQRAFAQQQLNRSINEKVRITGTGQIQGSNSFFDIKSPQNIPSKTPQKAKNEIPDITEQAEIIPSFVGPKKPEFQGPKQQKDFFGVLGLPTATSKTTQTPQGEQKTITTSIGIVQGEFPKPPPRPTASGLAIQAKQRTGVDLDLLLPVTEKFDDFFELNKLPKDRSLPNQLIEGASRTPRNFVDQLALAPEAVSRDIDALKENQIDLARFFGSSPLGQLITGGQGKVTEGQKVFQEKSSQQETFLGQAFSGKIPDISDPGIIGSGIGEGLIIGLGPKALGKATGKISTGVKSAINQRKVAQIAKATDEGLPQSIEKVSPDRFIIDRGTETRPAEIPLSLIDFAKSGKTRFVRGKPIKDSLPNEVQITGTIDEITAKSFGLSKQGNVFSKTKLNAEDRLLLRGAQRKGELAEITDSVNFPTSEVTKGKASEFAAITKRPTDERLLDLVTGRKGRLDITKFLDAGNRGFEKQRGFVGGSKSQGGTPVGSIGTDRKLLDVGLSLARSSRRKSSNSFGGSISLRDALGGSGVKRLADSSEDRLAKLAGTGLSRVQKKTIKKNFAGNQKTKTKNPSFGGLPLLPANTPASLETEVIAFPPGSNVPQGPSLDLLPRNEVNARDDLNRLLTKLTRPPSKQRQDQTSLLKADKILGRADKKRKKDEIVTRQKDILSEFTPQITSTNVSLIPALGQVAKQNNVLKENQKLNEKVISPTITGQTTPSVEINDIVLRTEQKIPPELARSPFFFRFPFFGFGQGGRVGSKQKRQKKKFIASNLDEFVPGVISRRGVDPLRVSVSSGIFEKQDRAIERARKKARKQDIFGDTAVSLNLGNGTVRKSKPKKFDPFGTTAIKF